MPAKMPAMMMIVMLIIAIVSIFFVQAGVGMHSEVLVEEAAFHGMLENYWSITKSERDAAPTGSQLNQDLVEISKFPSELLRLKLVGIGKILTGIFIALLGILLALIMMPLRLGMILQQNLQQKMQGRQEPQ